MTNSCSQCKFFQDLEAGIPNPRGVCCFKPPTVTVFLATKQGIRGQEPAPLTLTSRPSIMGADRACSEFSPLFTN